MCGKKGDAELPKRKSLRGLGLEQETSSEGGEESKGCLKVNQRLLLHQNCDSGSSSARKVSGHRKIIGKKRGNQPEDCIGPKQQYRA